MLYHRLGVADHRHQLAHRLLGIRHHVLALLRRRIGLIGRGHRRIGIARYLQSGGAQLLERGRHQIHLLILGLHAGTGTFGDAGSLFGAGAGASDGIDDLADGALQFVEEAVEPLGQLANLVVTAQLDALGEIPSPLAMSLRRATTARMGPLSGGPSARCRSARPPR